MAGAMASPQPKTGVPARSLSPRPPGSRAPSPRQSAQEAPLEVAQPLPDEELSSCRKLFYSIFRDCTPEIAKRASLAEREQASLSEERSLRYSELDINTMHQILNLVKRELATLHVGKGSFLDIGSGAGKALIAAGLLHPFERVVGIERLTCLSEFATAAREKFRAAALPGGSFKPEVQLLQKDFVQAAEEGEGEEKGELQSLVPEVVVCLAVSTCYGEVEMQAIGKLSRKMPAGSILITFTQELPECFLRTEAGDWTMVHREQMTLMWGESTCFILKKVPVTRAVGPGAENDA